MSGLTDARGEALVHLGAHVFEVRQALLVLVSEHFQREGRIDRAHHLGNHPDKTDVAAADDVLRGAHSAAPAGGAVPERHVLRALPELEAVGPEEVVDDVIYALPGNRRVVL